MTTIFGASIVVPEAVSAVAALLPEFVEIDDLQRKASPVILEPVMAVEVVTPEDFAGTIMGDLSSRRGRIEGMEHRAGSQVIKSIVPLAEMFGYATHMRSSTQGRAEYSMHFARYEEVPRSVADEIIGKAQGGK